MSNNSTRNVKFKVGDLVRLKSRTWHGGRCLFRINKQYPDGSFQLGYVHKQKNGGQWIERYDVEDLRRVST